MAARTQESKSIDSEAPLPGVFAQYRARGDVAGMQCIPAIDDEAIEGGLDAVKSFEELRVIDHVGLNR